MTAPCRLRSPVSALLRGEAVLHRLRRAGHPDDAAAADGAGGEAAGAGQQGAGLDAHEALRGRRGRREEVAAGLRAHRTLWDGQMIIFLSFLKHRVDSF